jgi:predicted amino acid-binding ACT domain protein
LQRAPFGEDDLFTMEAVIEIGPDVSLAKLKKTMDRLKRRLGVDIVISEHESHRED